MGFNIPNYTLAVANGAGDQAEPDSVDFQILGNAACALVYDPTEYPSNGAVSFSASWTLNVAAFHVISNGTHRTGASAQITLDAAESNPRFDLVVVKTDGTIGFRKGETSSTNPVFPSLTAGDVVLASVYVSTAGLSSTKITDKRVFIPSNTIRHESIAPTGSNGINGDLWINTGATGPYQSDLYYRSNGSWKNLADYVLPTSANTADTLVLRGAGGNVALGGITATSLALGTGTITAGAITVGAITATSLNLASGSISAGAITGTSITGTSLSLGSGNITTTGSIGAGAITGTSLALGSGNITTTGTITATTFSGALSGNAATASKWVTTRTISLTNDATGSANIDGSGNISISTTVNTSAYAALAGSAASVDHQVRDDASTPNTLVSRDGVADVYAHSFTATGGTIYSFSDEGTHTYLGVGCMRVLNAATVYGAVVSGRTVIVSSAGSLGTTASSRRFKENIKQYKDLNKKLLSVSPVTFDYKSSVMEEDSQEDRFSQFGLIAEDVDEAGLSHLVYYDKENKPESINYTVLSVELLGIVKQQQEEIDSLLSRIEKLEAKK